MNKKKIIYFLSLCVILATKNTMCMRRPFNHEWTHTHPRISFLIITRSSVLRSIKTPDHEYKLQLNLARKEIRKWQNLNKEAKSTSSTSSLVTLTVATLGGYLGDGTALGTCSFACVTAGTLFSVGSLAYSQFAFYKLQRARAKQELLKTKIASDTKEGR